MTYKGDRYDESMLYLSRCVVALDYLLFIFLYYKEPFFEKPWQFPFLVSLCLISE